jgi:ssDNA-binding Zn-finger/Zn-ribbon topoisomerase 1
MAIIDTDKIIINKTIIGITCNVCGGNLKSREKKKLAQKVINVVTLGKVNMLQYECENCKRHFLLM